MFEWTTGGTHCIPHWSWTVKAGEHEGYTLWFVAGGKGSLYLGEECYALSAGDIFFLDYRTGVRGTEDNTDCLRVYYLDFYPREPKAVSSFIRYTRCLSVSFTEKLYERFLSAHFHNDRENAALWAEAIVAEYCAASLHMRNTFPYAETAEEFCAQVQRSPGKKYDVCVFARERGISADYFIRIFKRIYGITPYRWLLSSKLEAAKALLTMSDCNVSETAERIGFSDVYAFSKFFRKETGVSPTEFRNQCKRKEVVKAGESF